MGARCAGSIGAVVSRVALTDVGEDSRCVVEHDGQGLSG